MMTMIKKSLLAAFACAALSTTAFAGVHYYSPVYVDEYSGAGGLGDARATANGTENIGCTNFGWVGSTAGYTFCWAVNADGDSVMCSSEEPVIVQAASAISSASYIRFTTDKYGVCETLDVQNFSGYTPMVP